MWVLWPNTHVPSWSELPENARTLWWQIFCRVEWHEGITWADYRQLWERHFRQDFIYRKSNNDQADNFGLKNLQDYIIWDEDVDLSFVMLVEELCLFINIIKIVYFNIQQKCIEEF